MKLGDLDLGRYFSTSKAQTNSSVGTPFYMSPECMRSQPYSFSSDVWSLGCVVCVFAHRCCARCCCVTCDCLLQLRDVRGQAALLQGERQQLLPAWAAPAARRVSPLHSPVSQPKLSNVGRRYDPVPSHYSAELAAIIGRCLSLDPLQRPTLEQLHPHSRGMCLHAGIAAVDELVPLPVDLSA